MNSSVYLFGNLSSGYTQYPYDGSHAIFTKFYQNAHAPTQICIRRQGSLMYYGYIRKLDSGRYMGFCVLLNDMIHNRIDKLFALFENTISRMVNQGILLHFNEKGDIVSSTSRLHEHPDEISTLMASLKGGFDMMEKDCFKLPPVDFSVASSSIKNFSISDDNPNEILKSSYTSGYTFVYKTRNYQSVEISSFSAKLSASYRQNESLKGEVSKLKSKIGELQRKQRNTTWVIILSAIIAMMGIILWFTVINPSEVTNKSFEEFDYYGSMLGGKPNGRGVAIYHKNDKDGRLYYVGNFKDGEREDDKAMLLYDNGDYFYGKMKGDHWEEGIFYRNTESSHFKGTFDKNNDPYTGSWYEHKFGYTIKEKKVPHGNR